MERNATKKWSCLILLAYLLLAVTGSFAFSTSEVFHYANFDGGRQDSAGFSPATVHAFVWLAEDAAKISEANGYSFSLFRNALNLVFASIFICSAATWFLRSYFLLIKNDKTIIFKNNILLKLRI